MITVKMFFDVSNFVKYIEIEIWRIQFKFPPQGEFCLLALWSPTSFLFTSTLFTKT